MKPVEFLASAEQEMRESAQYYETRVPGLGKEFLNQIERATDRIAEYPEAGVRIRGETRRRMLRRFPFGLLYRIEEEQIVVTAIMHLHRKPGYWEDRV